MLESSFDVVTAVRDLAVELDVLRRRVRLLEDTVAALGAPAAEAGGEPAGRKGSKREAASGLRPEPSESLE